MEAFDYIPCPACEYNEYKIIGKNQNRELLRIGCKVYFQDVICLRCGSIYSNPMPNVARVSSQYKNPRKDPFVLDIQKAIEIDERRYSRIIETLLEIHPKSGNLLDIGSGGGLLCECAKNKGLNTVGLDCSYAAIKGNQNKHVLNLIHGDIYQPPLKPNTFDFIVMLHVIEHFSDPYLVIRRIKNLLKKNGILYIQTPNVLLYTLRELNYRFDYIYSFFSKTKWMPHGEAGDHLVNFTPLGLRLLMERIGFKYIRFLNHKNYYPKINIKIILKDLFYYLSLKKLNLHQRNELIVRF